MSQKNGFGSGFIIGSIIGGVVGGVLGTVLATSKEKQVLKTDSYQLQKGQKIPFNTEESIEVARHGLENKIAQLNLAIDDVREQLGSVKSSADQD